MKPYHYYQLFPRPKILRSSVFFFLLHHLHLLGNTIQNRWRCPMCTAITFSGKDFYFGRNLDLERTFGEEVVITPRCFPLRFRHQPTTTHHYAIIGMAHAAEGYPLYYDAMNEAGVCMAGLNFPGFAHYQGVSAEKTSIASFEFIPWVLSQCGSVEEVRKRLPELNFTDTAFSPRFPPSPLHWIIADRNDCICVEPMSDSIRIYENPIGVLTNSPPFDDQMLQLCNFMHLSPNPPHNHFNTQLTLIPYSRGMGAMGLPGDLSSQSRFVRAAFTKLNSLCTDEESLSQFFHILETVSQTKGCCRLEDGSCEITQYTSCCNASRGIYYYTTYGNRRICAVDLHKENLDGDRLIRFPLITGEDVRYLN